jgi:hypothetical protein
MKMPFLPTLVESVRTVHDIFTIGAGYYLVPGGPVTIREIMLCSVEMPVSFIILATDSDGRIETIPFVVHGDVSIRYFSLEGKSVVGDKWQHAIPPKLLQAIREVLIKEQPDREQLWDTVDHWEAWLGGRGLK